MNYREKELADYLEDCRNREVTPRLHCVKHLKSMIAKAEKKQRELLELARIGDFESLWKRLGDRK